MESNIHVPIGTATAIPVPIIAFPLAGTTFVSAAYMSYPAANLLPRVGVLADGVSLLICNAGVRESDEPEPFVCGAEAPLSEELSPGGGIDVACW